MSEATDKIIAAVALLTTPRPAWGELPQWARGTWTHAMSFQSGVRRESAPTKPISEQTTADRMAIFLASIGRVPTPSLW
jgi:hypothetical protein